MMSLVDDLCHSLRMVSRQPGGTALAILVLALGLGASTAVFSIVYCVLLRPFSYDRPGRLVEVMQTHEQLGEITATAGAFLEWREGSGEVFDCLAAAQATEVDLISQGRPERVEAARVSSGLFEALGVAPVLGRTLMRSDERSGSERVAVVGDRLWRDCLAADPDLLGRSITINGFPHAVVGVLPAGFGGPEALGLADAEVWMPLVIDPRQADRQHVEVLGRLRPKVSIERARSVMDVLGARTGPRIPGDPSRVGAAVVSLREMTVGGVRTRLLLLLGAVGLTLLIACANVANLRLAQGLERSRELAIRRALGASRGRIARQLLTESTLTALAGGGFGVILAHWTVRGVVRLCVGELPRSSEVGITPGVMVFALAISVIAGIVSGVAPALIGSRVGESEALRAGRNRSAGSGVAGRRLRSALVVGELALTLMLVIGAGLLINSFVRLMGVDVGFCLDNAVTFRVSMNEADPRGDQDRALLFSAVLDHLCTAPGVEAVGAVGSLPLSDSRSSTVVREARQARPSSPLELPIAAVEPVTPGYFAAMEIPLAMGRSFTPGDHEGSPPVVIVNQKMAGELWPGESPLGKQLVSGWGSERPPATVVGVVGDVRLYSPWREAELQMYVPYLQRVPRGMDFVVRTSLDPAAQISFLRAAVSRASEHHPIFDARTLRDVYWSSLGRRQLLTMALAVFAVLALALSITGVYGVMSYTVSRRAAEFGVRLAIGAEPRQVIGLALEGGMTLTLIGLVLGVGLALGFSRFLGSQLFAVQPTDPTTFIAVSLVLVAAAGLACVVPARRAARVDPVASLRAE